MFDTDGRDDTWEEGGQYEVDENGYPMSPRPGPRHRCPTDDDYTFCPGCWRCEDNHDDE